MNSYKHIKRDLTNLGLSEKQADIYLLLLEYKELRINKITKLTNLPRSSVYENLSKLLEIGLVEEIIENNYKVIRPYSVNVLKHDLDEKISSAEKQRVTLKRLEKSIARSTYEIPHTPIVHYYRGRSGARQVFWNSLKTNDVIYVFSEWGRGRYVGIKFYENFVAESHKRKIKEKVLINPTSHAISSIKKHTGTPISRTKIDRIRCIPKDKVNIKGDSLMYDDVFAQLYLKDVEISGFEIQSKRFVKNHRSIFEILWESAEPLADVLKRS